MSKSKTEISVGAFDKSDTGCVKLYFESYKGAQHKLHIRRMYKSKDEPVTEFKHAKQGISVSLERIETLIKGLEKAIEKAKKEGLM